MAKTEVTPVQIQMAAAAGVKLLQQDDLMVPLQVAKSGALSVLEGVLTGLANGDVVLANAQDVENISPPPIDPPSAPVENPPDAANGNGEAAPE